MPRFTIRKSHKVGLAPGSLVPVEVREDAGPARITVLEYGTDHQRAETIDSVERAASFREREPVAWINVDGLHDVEVLERLGSDYQLHPLVLEDILNTETRPKLEDYEDYLFMVLKMLTFDPDARQVREEQLSVVLGEGWVLSFQEREGDVLEPVRDRIRRGKGRIRRSGSDYLAYALVDAVVDHYFVVLEEIGDWADRIEVRLLDDPDERLMHEIHQLKRELLHLRRSVWPVRELVNGLHREGTSLVSPDVRVYVRDAYDHTIQVIDTTETYRDLVSGTLDTYLTSVSNRMNEIMKVLTIMASLFIPLTFVAGVYGMNFENMPELAWPWGYPVVLGGMGLMAAGMLYYFWRKGWL